jgi:RNA polymerase sigma factor (sigma-70 family)
MNRAMDERDWLGRRFEDHRARLRSVAFRILGSTAEADDAVQEAWLRLVGADPTGIDNLGGWLTTVVGRVCLDMLRSRRTRDGDPGVERWAEQSPTGADPEHEALISDSIGWALLIVMDTLSPSERLAFVLHDMFAVPFDEIAGVLGCTPTTARQYASRGRRRIQGGTDHADADVGRRQQIVDAFLAASRNGKFDALIALLHPDASFHADTFAVGAGAEDATGARGVADVFAGRAKAAEGALIDGEPGVIWRHGTVVRAAFRFTIADDRITAIDLVMDPDRLSALEIVAAA